MIRARYSPGYDDLVGQILEYASAGLRTDPGFERKLNQCLRILREDLGYEISVEVEVHGAIEDAFRSLEGDTSEYVLHQRPVRRVKT